MKVLIAVGMTELAHELLRTAASRKWPPKTEFVLMHAIGTKELELRAAEDALETATKQQIAQTSFEYAHDLLMELGRLLPAHKISAVTTFGVPAERILGMSNELSVDLIMVGHDGASDNCSARVAECVVRDAQVTVEVVPLKPKPAVLA